MPTRAVGTQVMNQLGREAGSHYGTQVGVGLSEFFSASTPVVDPLWTDLRDMIQHKARLHPRSQQRALGPSQVGHPCHRKLALSLMDHPRINPEWDCLPSAFGVAMHTWLEDAAQMDNERLGRERWLTERKVEVAPGLSGTADLYDTDTNTVLDWKNLGYTSFPKHVKDIGPTYRNQVQMYGRGYRRLGYEVKDVAVVMLPRTGTLTKMHLEKIPYSDAEVDAVLARRDLVLQMIYDLDVENHPERYSWFAITPETCTFCAYWSPNPRAPGQCDGKV